MLSLALAVLALPSPALEATPLAPTLAVARTLPTASAAALVEDAELAAVRALVQRSVEAAGGVDLAALVGALGTLGVELTVASPPPHYKSVWTEDGWKVVCCGGATVTIDGSSADPIRVELSTPVIFADGPVDAARALHALKLGPHLLLGRAAPATELGQVTGDAAAAAMRRATAEILASAAPATPDALFALVGESFPWLSGPVGPVPASWSWRYAGGEWVALGATACEASFDPGDGGEALVLTAYRGTLAR